MREQPFKAAIAIGLFVTAGVAVFGQASGGDESPRRTEQSKRGQSIYEVRCSECHDGGIMGPELRGGAFATEWQGRKLSALYDVIVKTMPADNPGTLNQPDSLALVAYLLEANRALPDDSPLEDPAALDAMTFKSAH